MASSKKVSKSEVVALADELPEETKRKYSKAAKAIVQELEKTE
jgi:hypothetical protein